MSKVLVNRTRNLHQGDFREAVVHEKSNGHEFAGKVPETVASSATTSAFENSAQARELPPFFLPAVIIGRIAAIRPAVGALVDFPANTSGSLLPARSLIALTQNEAGREVALVFEDGDPSRPIIVGMMQNSNQPETVRPAEIALDHDSLILSAKKDVVIRCGKASITLTSAGKLFIQGEYVVSRSSGVNKIRGAAVQIN